MSETVQSVTEEAKLPVCESTLMPVADEYAYIHHNSIEIGAFRYVEKAP